jgi:ABC-2 type transport system permease protein
MEVRSDFFFERIRSLCIFISLYYLWSTLLKNQLNLWTYDKSQLLTYVFLMTLLRAWVLSCVTYRMPVEIAKGKISEVLLRPMSYLGYWATQDAANKALNLTSALVELTVFSFIVSTPFLLPDSWSAGLGFAVSTLFAMIMFFQMSYMLGMMGFWTSQSMGPWFCFEIILEFCAGAYFPIDLLPASVQQIINYLPFPYLVFYPISIYLNKLSGPEILFCLMKQMMWIGVLSLGVMTLWSAGMKRYSAEGG